MKKITIKEIAQLANVSVSTVSNVINGKGKCSLETKEKIFQIMKAHNYQPNQAARTLASKKSGLIGILFPPEDKFFRENNSYEKIITSITKELNKKTYNLVIGNNSNNLNLLDWKNKLDLEGLIIVGNLENDLEGYISALKIPVVFIDNYKNNLYGVSYINSDDTIGGFEATEVLIKNGCKKIGFVGSEDAETHSRRYLGYQSALMEYSLGFENLYLCDNSYEGGTEVAHNIDLNTIDGLCVATDIIAFGLLSSLKKLGKQIPEDIKIIGFANTDSCKYTTPTLSSVDLNFPEKGRLAVRMIFDEINGVTFLRNQSIDLNIVIRESV
jgi:DNA-binding LacI/PurR family transcriptional regulator